jgi:hypothetical protein
VVPVGRDGAERRNEMATGRELPSGLSLSEHANG